MSTPKKFFGCDLIRAMGRSGAALEIGLDGIALVSLIVMEWDRFDYLKPAAFRLPTLLERTGLRNKQAYYRVEERCLKAGWLVKKPNGTRGPVLYEATIPPAGLLVRNQSDDDLYTEEIRTNKPPESGPIPDPKADQSRTNPALSLSDSPSLDIPLPLPDPNAREVDPQDLFSKQPKTTETPAEVVGLFAPYVVCFSRDPGRTEENQRLLVTLYRSHGRLALHAAERAAFDAHERVYPDRVADQLIAIRADQSEAKIRTNLRMGPPPKPKQVIDATAIVLRDGFAACLARLDLFPHQREKLTSNEALIAWLEDDEVYWPKRLVEKSAKQGAA